MSSEGAAAEGGSFSTMRRCRCGVRRSGTQTVHEMASIQRHHRHVAARPAHK